MNDDQRAVLAHMVPDAEAWYAHTVTTFGEVRAAQMLHAKVERCRPIYENAVRDPAVWAIEKRSEITARVKDPARDARLAALDDAVFVGGRATYKNRAQRDEIDRLVDAI